MKHGQNQKTASEKMKESKDKLKQATGNSLWNKAAENGSDNGQSVAYKTAKVKDHSSNARDAAKQNAGSNKGKVADEKGNIKAGLTKEN